MKVTVKLYSIFRLNYSNYNEKEGIQLDVERGATAADLIEILEIDPQKVAMICINGEIKREKDITLTEGDIVQIFPFFGGG